MRAVSAKATVSAKTGYSGLTLRETGLYEFKAGQSSPIDVVKLKDGSFVSLDHRRMVLANSRGETAGGDYLINAVSHESTQKLTKSEIERFTLKERDVLGLQKRGFEVNNNPKTWGDAVELRILKQELNSKGFSTKYPGGMPGLPSVKGVFIPFSL